MNNSNDDQIAIMVAPHWESLIADLQTKFPSFTKACPACHFASSFLEPQGSTENNLSVM